MNSSNAKATTSGASATCSKSPRPTHRPSIRAPPQAHAPPSAPWHQREKCQALVEEWYRQQIREAVAPLDRQRWETRLGVKVERIFVQRMKTKWGSCNPATRSIRLNTDLAKKPPECLEYIVVHELMHLLEPTHNARFQALMDQHLPKWRSHRQTLNRLPVRHESWGY